MKLHRIFSVMALSLLCGGAEAQTSTGLVDVKINGDVRCIQPMGDGSFVAGGYTYYYNGQRDTGLLRLRADGTRVAFPVNVDGNVVAMALAGGWLYLGGDFQGVNGANVPFIARVNAATGAVDAAWRPAPNGDIIDLVPAPGGIVLAGSFSKVGGLPRSRVALVSAAGAGKAIETWKCDADAQVDCLALQNGRLFLGGRFKKVNTTVISYLANVDAASGVVNPAWNPTPQFHVYDIAADATHLYCGGSFGRMGAGGPPFLTRVNLSTGTVDTTWAPNPNGLVTSVAVSGDSVYAAGTWTLIGNIPQQWIARAAKAASGADNTWLPPVDGAVRTLAPDGANGVWAGGRFSSPASPGAGMAHFTSTQGGAPPSYPGRIENTGAVKAVVQDAGSWLCGGDFDTVNGTRKPALFRLAPGGSVDANWKANLEGFYPRVNAMDVIPDAAGGAEVIIAGQFEVHNGTQILYNCLKLKTATGALLTAFAPLPDNEVEAMVKQGGVWVLGGHFDKLGNITAPALARITGAGLVDAGWKPQPDGPVMSLLADGDDLYAGGLFSSFGKPPTVYPVPYLARVVGLVPDLGWQPRPNDAVFTMATDGAHLYAGGRFTKMARSKRQYLAQLPTGGAGTATAWNPKPSQSVHALRLDGNYLYAGGAFFSIAGYQWPKLARFRRTDLTLDQDFRTTGEDGFVTCIAPQTDGSLFIGGSFSGWDDSFSKRSLVKIQPGPPLQPNPPPADLFAGDDESDDTLSVFFAGDSSRSLVAPLPAETGPGLEWKENAVLPAGMVAQVQWSHDLKSWHESGDTADGLTRLVTITMDGASREARVLTEGSPPGERPPLYLRLAVIPGNASSPLHP